MTGVQTCALPISQQLSTPASPQQCPTPQIIPPSPQISTQYNVSGSPRFSNITEDPRFSRFRELAKIHPRTDEYTKLYDGLRRKYCTSPLNFIS